MHRLALERLEDRLTPSASPCVASPGFSGQWSRQFDVQTKPNCSPTNAAIVDGHILHIEGTATADRIAILDNGQGVIQVTLDGDAPRVYPGNGGNSSGIDQIEVITFGGTDSVDYELLPAVHTGDMRPANLLFDLGSGGDLLNIRAEGPMDLPSGGWQVDAYTGTGNDQMFVTFQGAIPGIINADLGAGRDAANFDFESFLTPTPRGLTVNGGDGDDVISVTHVFQIGIESSEYTSAATNRVDLFDDKGSNDITVTYRIVAILQPDDFAAPPPEFYTALQTSIHTGGGRDDIGVIYDCTATGGTHDVMMAAPITLDIASGGGADRIAVSVAHTPFSEAPGGCDRFIFAAPITFNIFSGAGNDTTTVMRGDASCRVSGRAPILNSSFSLVTDSGDGNDLILVDLLFADESLGLLDARLLGGAGNDDLTLDIFYPDHNNVSALVDGGNGIDIAHPSDGIVRVQNCER